MRCFVFIALVLGITCSCVFPRAADPGFLVSVRAEVSRAAPAVGDPVILDVEIRYPAGAGRPELVRDFPADVALLGEDPVTSRTENEQVHERRRLHVAFFETGTRRIGAIRYTCRHHGRALEARSSPIIVKVRTLRSEKENGLDKPEPPWIIPFPAWRLATIIGGVLILIAAAGFVVWWWLRRRRRDEIPVIPPDLQARDRLQQLAGQDLPRQGRLRDFYFLVSEIVKDYLGKELGVVVLERTTAEILEQLPRVSSLTPEAVEMAVRFLRAADRVKFARYMATPADADAALKQAFEIVRQVHARVLLPAESIAEETPRQEEVAT